MRDQSAHISSSLLAGWCLIFALVTSCFEACSSSTLGGALSELFPDYCMHNNAYRRACAILVPENCMISPFASMSSSCGSSDPELHLMIVNAGTMLRTCSRAEQTSKTTFSDRAKATPLVFTCCLSGSDKSERCHGFGS